MLGTDVFSRRLGLVVDELGDGFCRVSMLVTSEMVNGFGIAHGGVVFSLADSAMAFASNHGDNVFVATGNSISYVEPVHVGDRLVANAVEISRSGRTAIFDVSVSREQTVVALFRGTVFKTDTQHIQES
jgi:acyl-CoA thioesterase